MIIDDYWWLLLRYICVVCINVVANFVYLWLFYGYWCLFVFIDDYWWLFYDYFMVIDNYLRLFYDYW